jgi:hypothetical protein
MAPFNLHHVIFYPGMIIPRDYVENMEIFQWEIKIGISRFSKSGISQFPYGTSEPFPATGISLERRARLKA